MEDGNMRGAAPECAGLGWVYYNGHCYLFDRLVGKLVGWLGCLGHGCLMVILAWLIGWSWLDLLQRSFPDLGVASCSSQYDKISCHFHPALDIIQGLNVTFTPLCNLGQNGQREKGKLASKELVMWSTPTSDLLK